MIYSVILVDGDSGILLLERQIRSMESKSKISSEILAAFFKTLNIMIDEIQFSMRKGRDVSNMIRVVTSENSTIIIYYHPQSRVLLCSISDPDDDLYKIIDALKILGKRFFQKFRKELELFRKENSRDIFTAFTVDIDTYTLDGRIGELFPKISVSSGALERIKTMGLINNFEYEVALLCNGKRSPLAISRKLGVSRERVNIALSKLSELDIIKEF